MEIEEIGIREIPDASIDTTIIRTSNPQIPSNIGFPVIQMPGCVRARTLKNKNLVTTDPAGNFYVCDGNVPTLESMAVDWDGLSAVGPVKAEEPEIVPPIPKLKGNQRKEVEEENSENDEKGDTDVGQQEFKIPDVDGEFIADILPCPPLDTLAKTPVGSLGKGGLARIKGWKRDELTGKCETVWEGLSPIEIAGNYAPQPTVLVNTSVIAVTSVIGVTVIGQPIAKFFQKQVKGQVKSFSKKITKKLLAIRGKKPPVKSLAERKKDQRDSRK
tara:strand:+ start:1434 stop:2252 length:819 start_codon:yes stop_codon:yes gene_type:complete